MNRFTVAALALLGAVLLQAGLAPYLTILGVTPNFILLVVVTLALTEGPTTGAIAGFVGGLCFDLLTSGPVGPMALVLSVTGYFAGLLHEQMFAEGWLLPLTMFAIAALGSEVAYSALLVMLGEGESFMRGLLTTAIPAALYNTVLALLVYPWLARVLRRDRPMTTFRRLA
jgi:rod shape-determining protein MreD